MMLPMDNLTKAQRQKNMRNIRSKGTSIEKVVRSGLRRAGIRFRANVRTIPGKPDFVFRDARVIVFLDSCFWHSCPYHATQPKSNRTYWQPKLKRNKERDRIITKALKKSGWKVLRIWEHRIKKDPLGCLSLIGTRVHLGIKQAHRRQHQS
jgi:DNA mismatch endonuclease (patch repair protein)